jgi:hypothetical protein
MRFLFYLYLNEIRKQELVSIVEGMMKHIDQLKADVKQKYSSQEHYERSRSAMHEKIFGNVWTTDTMTIVKGLLFESQRNVTVPVGNGGNHGVDRTSSGSTRMVPKPRLRHLAHQLHLSMDKISAEAERFFSDGEFMGGK